MRPKEINEQDTSSPEGLNNVEGLAVGTLFDNRFEIAGEIGRGGYSIVYRAHDRQLDRDVALKILSAGSQDPQVLIKFRNEARTSSLLDHPNIVRLMANGVTEEGEPYLVMELLQGLPLNSYLKATGTMLANEFKEIFFPVLDALIFAHAQGVIHRDLKPSNIFLWQRDDGSRTPKLLDFGIAALADKEQQGNTTNAGPIGTPLYMSPEQCRGSKVDARADVYSLACVMYEALTGRPPFSGETPFETMYEHLTKSVPKFDELSGPIKIPRAVAISIVKALSKAPEQRQASAQFLKDELAMSFASSTGYTILGIQKRAKRSKFNVWALALHTLIILCLVIIVTVFLRPPPKGPVLLPAAPSRSTSITTAATAIGPYSALNTADEEFSQARVIGVSTPEGKKKMETAEGLLGRAIDSMEAQGKEADQDLLVKLYRMMGDGLRDDNKYTMALIEFQKAEKVLAVSSTGKQSRLINKRAIADVYRRMKLPDKARQTFEEAIADYRKVCDTPCDLELAKTYAFYARDAARSQADQTRLSETAIDLARCSYHDILDADILETINSLGSYYRKIGQPEKALDLLDEAERKLMTTTRLPKNDSYKLYYLKTVCRGNIDAHRFDVAKRLDNLSHKILDELGDSPIVRGRKEEARIVTKELNDLIELEKQKMQAKAIKRRGNG